MKVSQDVHHWLEYHNLHSKNTIKTYHSILSKLAALFGERDLIFLKPEEVLDLLGRTGTPVRMLFKESDYM